MNPPQKPAHSGPPGMRVSVTYHRASPRSTYYTYADGRVLAWGTEIDPSGEGTKYIASVWSAHPMDDSDAVHLGHLVVDSTWRDFMTELERWGQTGEGLM